MKKLITLFIIVILGSCFNTFAVLKEKDLGSTLSILKTELRRTHEEQVVRMKNFERINKMFMQQMLSEYKRADQIALMLYSQKSDYIFDLTYACSEATGLFDEYNRKRVPFNSFVESANDDIVRYKEMIRILDALPNDILENEQQKRDKNECIKYAQLIKRDMIIQREKVKETQKISDGVSQYIGKMNGYAVSIYEKIRKNIFINGETHYVEILENISRYNGQANRDLKEKYNNNRNTKSEWRGSLIGFLGLFILFYLLISSVVCSIIIRFFIPKSLKTREFRLKQRPIIITASFLTFSFVLFILSTFVLHHNFFILASTLTAEYAWMVGVIFLSLVIRIKDRKVSNILRSYVPMMIVGFVVFGFRITFMPSSVVNLYFPAIMLICTIWQAICVLIYFKDADLSDKIYTVVSLIVMVTSTVMSWSGYTLMSVQVLIWWIMQLTVIQTITCIYFLLHSYEKKHIPENADLRKTWFYDAIYKMIVPIASVFSVVFTIIMATDIFDLSEWCKMILEYNFINIPDMITANLIRILFCVSLWFIFHYILYLERMIYVLYKTRNSTNGKAKSANLTINIIRYIGWGIYIFFVLLILHVNKSGITLILTGLSTGIGFAMKDTLENLFYGISLMTGRVKLGDYIECDGIRGRVTNINYQSTLVETLDGSVIAFLNSQLFSKNFKNLTRNHGFELAKISVGVAYGSNVNQVRNLIIERISSLDCYQKSKGVNVLFDNFGDSSVDLTVVVWISVKTRLADTAEIKEAIYNVLNENNIEIPFPQRDLNIKGMELAK